MRLPDPSIDNAPALAFCYAMDFEPGTHGWHAHNRHQLVYAVSGVLQLEAEAGQWLLPPQRAAWVAADKQHLTRYLTPVSLRSICFDPTFPDVPQADTRVFSVTPLAREMIVYGMRWGTDRDPDDAKANLFFQTLAILCEEWMAEEPAFRLPRAKTPELAQAIEYTLENLQEITIDEVTTASNLSARTLRRRMQQETGISWQKFLHTARMMRAMEILATPEAQVTETALAVGYNSLSAFIRAFTRFTSETPGHYRQRVQS